MFTQKQRYVELQPAGATVTVTGAAPATTSALVAVGAGLGAAAEAAVETPAATVRSSAMVAMISARIDLIRVSGDMGFLSTEVQVIFHANSLYLIN
jgi:hypothetical protein